MFGGGLSPADEAKRLGLVQAEAETVANMFNRCVCLSLCVCLCVSVCVPVCVWPALPVWHVSLQMSL